MTIHPRTRFAHVSCLLVASLPWRLVADGWPQWRGPLATGEAPDADPPVAWSENDNMRWKVALPGLGHSTPVVWGDRLFVTTAIAEGKPLPPRFSGAPGAHDNAPVDHRYAFAVLAVRRRDGKVLWQQVVHREVPREGGHYSGSLASNSPVTDGKRVWAFFGSRGLYCLDIRGKLLWHRSLGVMHTKHGHGEGASPVLYRDWLVVNWDHEGQSFIVALDALSGRERWRVLRDEPTSWATPIVVEVDGGQQVVACGTHRIRGYQLTSGKVAWECGGLSANIVASPVFGSGMLFAGSSYDSRAVLALRLSGARGDITRSERVVWRRVSGAPYVPSPLLYRGALYTLNHYQPVLSRIDIYTGEDAGGPFRLGGLSNIYASPVAAAGRVYITDLRGSTVVLSAEASPRALALNHLDDSFAASPALAGNELYLRGRKWLYCVAKSHSS